MLALAVAVLILPNVARLQLKPPPATYIDCRYSVSAVTRAGGFGPKVREARTCGPNPPQAVALVSA